MEEKKTWKYYVRASICGIVILLVCFMIAALYSTADSHLESEDWKVSYNKGWNVYFEGQEYRDVDFSEFSLPHTLNLGETVTISNRIPDDMERLNYSYPVIKLITRNATVSVSVNGKERYSYGQELFAKNKMVGSGIHHINLKPMDTGKIITITYTAAERQSFTVFDEINIYDGDMLTQYELVSGKVPFTVSLLLIMLGFCIMILTAIVCIKTPRFVDLFFIGCSSVLIGGWSLCYYGYIQLFDVAIYRNSVLEYVSMYLYAVPMLLYFRTYVDATQNGRMKRLYRLILGAQIAADIIFIGLHLTGIMHLPATLPLMHMLIAIEIVYVMTLLIMNSKKGDLASKTILFGTIIMVLFIAAEFIVYALKKYRGIQITNQKGFAAIGMLIFIFALISAFAVKIAENVKITTEKEILYRMAYTDDLTKLYNRRYCEQKLKSLSKDQMEYGIINLDLNNLKGINDTQGHHMGDALIAGFADILKHTFDGVGTVGRMGGDEFIVIIEGLNGFDIQKYIGRLMENIQKANKKKLEFEYSTSYGYADSIELAKDTGEKCVDAECVYKLADSRMYENKRAYKENI